jgi:hypothetical protein
MCNLHVCFTYPNIKTLQALADITNSAFIPWQMNKYLHPTCHQSATYFISFRLNTTQIQVVLMNRWDQVTVHASSNLKHGSSIKGSWQMTVILITFRHMFIFRLFLMGAHFCPNALTVIHHYLSSAVRLIYDHRSRQVQVRLHISVAIMKCSRTLDVRSENLR